MHQKEGKGKGNSLKPTKMCSFENGLWLLRCAGRPTPKMIKDGVENIKIGNINEKGNAEREREREGELQIWFFKSVTLMYYGLPLKLKIFELKKVH